MLIFLPGLFLVLPSLAFLCTPVYTCTCTKFDQVFTMLKILPIMLIQIVARNDSDSILTVTELANSDYTEA